MGSGRPVGRRPDGAGANREGPAGDSTSQPESDSLRTTAPGGATAPGGRVIVRIERFIGHGAHVHVSMREETGPRGGEPTQRPDPTRGRERYMKFRDRRRALQWVDATFQAEFDPDNQELVFLEGATRRWFYGEGD